MEIIQRICNSAVQIFRFWFKPLIHAVIKTIITIFGLVGADIVFSFISYLIAFFKKESPILSDFYPHYYFDGVLIGVAIILGIWMIYEASQKHLKVEKELAHYSWSNVEIKPFKFNSNRNLGVGLMIVNKKQVVIKQARLPVDSICLNREDLYGRNNMSLLWVKDNKIFGTRIDICSGERVFAALANWGEDGAYIQSEWGKEEKSPSMGMDIGKKYIVDVALFGRPNDYSLDKGLHFVGELVLQRKVTSKSR